MKTTVRYFPFITVLIILFNSSGISAQDWIDIIKEWPSEVTSNYDYFGASVAMSGNIAVVGAYGEDYDVNNQNEVERAGAAYVLYKDQGGINNWGIVKKLTANERETYDEFGWSVAISGNYIVVGAYKEDDNAVNSDSVADAGSAYIFYKDAGGDDQWGLVKKIVASDRQKEDWFGYSVSISGDYVVVGALQEDEDRTGGTTLDNSGSAYVFYKDKNDTDNWGQVTKIVAEDRGQDDEFGECVSISGDNIIVGAWNEDEDEDGLNTLSYAGSAYLFSKNQG